VVEASLEALPAAMDAGGVAVLIVKRPKGGNHYVTVAVYDQEHITYHEPLRVRRWWGCGSGGWMGKAGWGRVGAWQRLHSMHACMCVGYRTKTLPSKRPTGDLSGDAVGPYRRHSPATWVRGAAGRRQTISPAAWGPGTGLMARTGWSCSGCWR